MNQFLQSSGGKATVRLASVAKAVPDGSTRNTIVLQRTLRVQLRDCRSGEPVKDTPVEEIRIGGSTFVRFRDGKADWDIATRLPYYKKGGKWAVGKTRTMSVSIATQEVLRGLGFDTGTPAETFGKMAKTAWLRFRVSTGEILLEPEVIAKLELYRSKVVPARHLPAGGQTVLRDAVDRDGSPIPFTSPTDAQAEDVLKFHNTLCYRTTQHYLAVLGFVPKPDDPLADGAWDETDSGTWSKEWITAYHEWQKAVLGLAENKCADWIIDPTHGEKLQAAQGKMRTNADGIVHIPLALTQLKEKWTVEISFPGMAIIAESSAKEYPDVNRRVARSSHAHPGAGKSPAIPAGALEPGSGPTGFAIEWADTQGKNDWDQPWGWRLGPAPAASPDERKNWPEFRSSWRFEVPAFNDQEVEEFDIVALQRRTGAFSVFFHERDADPHFVVFGLRWCQPVWDEIADPQGSEMVSEEVYLDSRKERGRHFHLVSMPIDLGGMDYFGGKGYAKYEQEVVPQFRGIDKGITEWGALLRLKALGVVSFSGDAEALKAAYYSELASVARARHEIEPGPDRPIMDEIAAYFDPLGDPTMAGGILNEKMIRHIDKVATQQLAKPSQRLPVVSGSRTLRDAEWHDPLDGHAGLDLHILAGNEDVGGSRKGSPVFAVHGGTIDKVSAWSGKSANAAGHAVFHKLPAMQVGYLHLDKALVKEKAAVRAGQIVGRAGRTGNFGNRQPSGSSHSTVSKWPSHLHLNVGGNNKLYRQPDEANRVCLPHNGSPLLLPCQCEVPAAADDPKDCRFGASQNKRPFIKRCWAVHEFRCPHMPTTATAADITSGSFPAVALLQAWLRRWQIDQGKSPDDADAVILDGALGNAHSRTRKAVRAYRMSAKLGENDTVDDALIDALSTAYPVTREFP